MAQRAKGRGMFQSTSVMTNCNAFLPVRRAAARAHMP